MLVSLLGHVTICCGLGEGSSVRQVKEDRQITVKQNDTTVHVFVFCAIAYDAPRCLNRLLVVAIFWGS